MKRSRVISIAIVSAIITILSLAQYGNGRGGRDSGNSCDRLYRTKTVDNFCGTIDTIQIFIPRKGMSEGVQIIIKTNTGAIPVHLGPSWFIDKQSIKFEPGDKVQVTGSRITFNNKPAIIASEVKKGDQILKLRDVYGTPAWNSRGAGG